MTRHELLAGLHAVLRPRTYLEIGVNDGRSLTLSRSTSIGVDPAFAVKSELCCDLQLVRQTSDDFFAQEDPLEHFGGLPIDLAFIDGMHLAEFAYRDFLNVERLVSNCGVVVLDDMLPRDVAEAARDRHTGDWAGDVFKMIGILRDRRPDLVVLPVNTEPTGVLVITALDPSSAVLRDSYDELLPELESADPQEVPEGILSRTVSVSAKSVLASTAWKRLVELREADADRASVARAVAGLRRIKRLG
jgi:Methyltransferase domain